MGPHIGDKLRKRSTGPGIVLEERLPRTIGNTEITGGDRQEIAEQRERIVQEYLDDGAR